MRNRWGIFASILLVSLLTACSQPPSAPVAVALNPDKLIDLSHAYDDSTIYWPTSPPFQRKTDAWGMSAGGYWYTSATFTSSEHGGTHLDAPIHFAEGKWSNAEIPVARLAGPARIIDVTEACAKDRDYLVTAADVEKAAVAANDIVLIRTGWSKFWPEKKAYMGSDKPGDAANLSFPGISPEAAKLLAEKKVKAVGIDTASIDRGKSADFQTHRILLAANIYGLENLDGLDRLPPTGATLIALPMKITNGTGGPARVVALLP